MRITTESQYRQFVRVSGYLYAVADGPVKTCRDLRAHDNSRIEVGGTGLGRPVSVIELLGGFAVFTSAQEAAHHQQHAGARA